MCICIQYTYSKSAATQSQLWRQLPEAAPTVTKTSTPLPEVITVHGVGFPQDVDKAPDVKSELPLVLFRKLAGHVQPEAPDPQQGLEHWFSTGAHRAGSDRAL